MSEIDAAELESSLLEIVRTDLKLDDSELTPTTPFSSEELGLDSLDYLMLITSIEKAYGIKMTAEEIGPETMRDLRTLAAYLQTKMS
jgi:acyl carrier protein